MGGDALMRTDLYRYFDKTGRLLYVGVSVSALIRLTQHSQTSEWFGQWVTMTRETYKDRTTALRAERGAIVKERPLYNKTHNFYQAPAKVEQSDPNNVVTLKDLEIGDAALDHQNIYEVAVRLSKGYSGDEVMKVLEHPYDRNIQLTKADREAIVEEMKECELYDAAFRREYLICEAIDDLHSDARIGMGII